MCEICKLKFILWRLDQAGEEIVDALEAGDYDTAMGTLISFVACSAESYAEATRESGDAVAGFDASVDAGETVEDRAVTAAVDAVDSKITFDAPLDEVGTGPTKLGRQLNKRAEYQMTAAGFTVVEPGRHFTAGQLKRGTAGLELSRRRLFYRTWLENWGVPDGNSRH